VAGEAAHVQFIDHRIGEVPFKGRSNSSRIPRRPESPARRRAEVSHGCPAPQRRTAERLGKGSSSTRLRVETVKRTALLADARRPVA